MGAESADLKSCAACRPVRALRSSRPAAAMSFFPELYFNVDNGYLEGLVRGLKAGATVILFGGLMPPTFFIPLYTIS